MKPLRILVAPLLAATLVVGCSDSIGPDSTPEEIAAALAGTWNATSFVFTNKANSAQTYDFFAAGGRMTLTITAAGGFTVNVTGAGENESSGGTYVASGTNLILTDALDPTDVETIAFTLSGSTLTLTLDDVYDFDGDLVEEAATLVTVLQRA